MSDEKLLQGSRALVESALRRVADSRPCPTSPRRSRAPWPARGPAMSSRATGPSTSTARPSINHRPLPGDGGRLSGCRDAAPRITALTHPKDALVRVRLQIDARPTPKLLAQLKETGEAVPFQVNRCHPNFCDLSPCA